jgi:transcriptional regulator of acetoin/glycerol metabolism
VTRLYASDVPWCLEPLLLKDVTLGGKRPNLLINCALDDAERVARDLAQWCAQPVSKCSMPGWIDVPTDASGTLLVTRIEEMTLDQQIVLFDWMTLTRQRTQIISLATTRLEQLVRDGRFLDGLLFRLNALQLDAWSPVRLGYEPAGCRKVECHGYERA